MYLHSNWSIWKLLVFPKWFSTVYLTWNYKVSIYIGSLLSALKKTQQAIFKVSYILYIL